MSHLIEKIKCIYEYYKPKDKLYERNNIRICAITMNYNDDFHLENWINYYGKELSEKNLIIIDHSSDNNSLRKIKQKECSVINLPRDHFDDSQRADFISGIASSILKYYDVVIYTDCDEILIPDPRKYTGLSDFFSKNKQECYTCIGLNVFNEIYEESRYNSDIPLFEQRKYVRFFSPMCKTLAVTKPVHWYGGFHGSDIETDFGDYSLFMFHMREVDFSQKLRRISVQRKLKWIDALAGYRNQRIPNKQLFEQWGAISLWEKSINFSEIIGHAKYVANNIQKLNNFNIVTMDYFPEKLYVIPSFFKSPF